MKTEEIIKEIQKLPIRKQIYIIEKSMHLMFKQQEEDQMKSAVEELYSDYLNDKELTAFTNIDFDSFYETR